MNKSEQDNGIYNVYEKVLLQSMLTHPSCGDT